MLRILISAFLAILTLSLPSYGQGKKAFIVGVAQYDNLQILQKTLGDVEGYSEVFRNDLGFEITKLIEPDLNTFEVEFAKFLETIESGDQVVFIFSGHGWSDGIENYLVMKDAPLSGTESLFRRQTIPLSQYVFAELKARNPNVLFAIIDACRNNPFDMGKRSYERGIVRIEKDPDFNREMIVFSAGEGETALDRLSEDDPSPYSVFTRYLLPRLKDGKTRLTNLVKDAAGEVRIAAATRDSHRQNPATYDNLDRHFCFDGVCHAEGQDAESRAFSNANTCTKVSEFLLQYPDGAFQSQARTQRDVLCAEEEEARIREVCTPLEVEFLELPTDSRISAVKAVLDKTPDACFTLRERLQTSIEQKTCKAEEERFTGLDAVGDAAIYNAFLDEVPAFCSILRVRIETLADALASNGSSNPSDVCEGARADWELVREQSSIAPIQAFQSRIADDCPAISDLASARIAEIKASPAPSLPVCIRADADWRLIESSGNLETVGAFLTSVKGCPEVAAKAQAQYNNLQCAAADAEWRKVENSRSLAVMEQVSLTVPKTCSTLLREISRDIALETERQRIALTAGDWRKLSVRQSLSLPSSKNMFGGRRDFNNLALSKDGRYFFVNTERERFFLIDTRTFEIKHDILPQTGIYGDVQPAGNSSFMYVGNVYVKPADAYKTWLPKEGQYLYIFDGGAAVIQPNAPELFLYKLRESGDPKIKLHALTSDSFMIEEYYYSPNARPPERYEYWRYQKLSGSWNKSKLSRTDAKAALDNEQSGNALIIEIANDERSLSFKHDVTDAFFKQTPRLRNKITSYSASPDGAYLAIASRKSVMIWNTFDGKLLSEWIADENLEKVVFANDGKSLFVGTKAAQLIELTPAY